MKSKSIMRSFFTCIVFLSITIAFTSCGFNSQGDEQYGIFTVTSDTSVEMDGELGSTAFDDLSDLLDDYPDIAEINIVDCGGSTDDAVNLEAALLVYDNDISTHIIGNGEIASGGVDFFLAGIARTMGTNCRIGVHSWSDGVNEATDFPVGDDEHKPYIEFYTAIGFSVEEAEDFYYFTISAASADDIHWMTEDEIIKYNVLK